MADYLATQGGLAAAETFLTEIDAILRRIAQFPQIGRKRDELYPNLRSLPYRQYLFFYLFRVVSSYQDLTALFEAGDGV